MRRERGSGWVERKGGGNLAVVWWTICLQRQLELRLSLTKIHKGEGLHFQHNILHFFAHNELTNASLANDEAKHIANSTFFLRKNGTIIDIHIIHTSVNTNGQHVHGSNVRPGRGRTLGFTQGSLYEVETHCPSCLLTASCHNHQMPTNTQISGSQPSPLCARLWWQSAWHHQSPGRCHVTPDTAVDQPHWGFVLLINRPVSLIL